MSKNCRSVLGRHNLRVPVRCSACKKLFSIQLLGRFIRRKLPHPLQLVQLSSLPITLLVRELFYLLVRFVERHYVPQFDYTRAHGYGTVGFYYQL